MTELAALPAGRLAFSFAECDQELTALLGIAGDFLDGSAEVVVRRFMERLRNIRSAPTGAYLRWEVPASEPVRTVPSRGMYEPGGGGGRSVYAAVDGVWQIEPLGNHNRGSLPHRKFALGGQASARVRLVDSDTDEELSMWRMEVGDATSPGCFFHVQIRGQDETLPFPSSVSVPRLPANAMLLPSTVEFVIAELFQREWAEASARETAAMRAWRPIQERRLARQYGWHQTVLATSTGSPLSRLKRERPPADLFL